MDQRARYAVAYVVARAASGQNASAIYDYETGSYHNFSGQVGDHVNVYDYGRGNYLTGPLNSLYDYAQDNYLEVKARGGGRFSGYDYASGEYFDATVRGRNVNVYDYETGTYYDYQI